MVKASAGVNSRIMAMIILLAVLAAGVAAGCSSSKSIPKNPSVDQIRDRIAQAVDLSGMKAGDGSKLEKLYGIDAGKLDGFVLYTASSNIRADEIAVLKVKDAADVKEIEEKITGRIDSQAASFKDYLPEQYFLVQKHVLKTDGRYVLFVISKDAAKIEAAFDDSLSRQ